MKRAEKGTPGRGMPKVGEMLASREIECWPLVHPNILLIFIGPVLRLIEGLSPQYSSRIQSTFVVGMVCHSQVLLSSGFVP